MKYNCEIMSTALDMIIAQDKLINETYRYYMPIKKRKKFKKLEDDVENIESKLIDLLNPKKTYPHTINQEYEAKE